MRRIEVHIKEKDKGSKELSLFNLRDEVVGFLFKDTVANSTKTDLQFFVLIYFASIKIKQKSFLELILDEGIPKFNKLNQAFAAHKGNLRAGEYRRMVEAHGLSELFEHDLFFVLADAIVNIDVIEPKYADFYEKDAELKRVINVIKSQYSDQLTSSFKTFRASKIQDDRYDEYGNYQDLSKSVYRTVAMRNSRNLELNLQKYTAVKNITSKSPLDLTFIQHVDPQIIFNLWDKYHVADYMASLWRAANDEPLLTAVLGGLILRYSKWKKTDGRVDRSAKDKAKRDFERAKFENSEQLDDLALRLVESVLKANEKLEAEIRAARKELSQLRSKAAAAQNTDAIKKLEDRIAKLENLEVTAKLTDDSKS